MTPLQIAVAIGTLAALVASGWNAWSTVKSDLAIARLRADFAEALADHTLAQADTLAALRLEMEKRFVTHEVMDKALNSFNALLNKLGGQLRELERIVDRGRGDESK